MNGSEIIVPVVASVFSAGVLTALITFLRERKVDQAKGAVATATVEIAVDTDRLALLEARMNLLTRTFDHERASLEATIANLQRENVQKDVKIAALQKRVEEVEAELARRPGPDGDKGQPPPTLETLESTIQDITKFAAQLRAEATQQQETDRKE